MQFLAIENWFVINEFRSKQLHSKRNSHTCNPMEDGPFLLNIL